MIAFKCIIFAGLAEINFVKGNQDDPQVSQHLKQFLRGLGRIKFSDPGVVPPDDKMAAAEILPADRGKNRFARARITGISGQGP